MENQPTTVGTAADYTRRSIMTAGGGVAASATLAGCSSESWEEDTKHPDDFEDVKLSRVTMRGMGTIHSYVTGIVSNHRQQPIDVYIKVNWYASDGTLLEWGNDKLRDVAAGTRMRFETSGYVHDGNPPAEYGISMAVRNAP